MKKWRLAALTLCAAVLLGGCAPAAPASSGGLLSPQEPVSITVWHYYNGGQLEAFSALVDEFNQTEGARLGVQVTGSSQGSVTDLAESVLRSARQEVGAAPLPNIFAAYADTAYALDQMGVVADIAPYLSEEQQALYVSGYLQEGRFGQDSLKIFPVAKSTEVLTINLTDWTPFAQATGATLDDLATIEGVTATAEAYYAWTDGLTPDVPNDGQAFFGRDAFANYMLIGAQQLGCEMLHAENGQCTLDFDRDVVRRLWDNYYVPMVAGWFAAGGRFRSDDVKLGSIIACVGSTSSATFFPTEVTISDTESYPIETAALAAPQFAGGQAYAVQQGAGMVVTQASEKEIAAAVAFLTWFTAPEQNTRFAAASGYLPVTVAANDADALTAAAAESGAGSLVQQVLQVGVDTVNENTMYTPGMFANGSAARDLLESAMPEKAAQDRQALLALLAQGVPYDEALAQFTTEENFDAWYTQTKAELERLCAAG